jgi:hypothetical protein
MHDAAGRGSGAKADAMIVPVGSEKKSFLIN